MINSNKRKAMSLTEVMISTACVGILAMILVPLMMKTTTNKETLLYAKAVNSMQNAISAVIGDYEAVNSSNFLPELSQNESIRAQLASKMSSQEGLRDVGASGSSASNPDFYSEDGMVWYDIPAQWPAGQDYIDVKVDVNGSGGKNLSSSDAGENEIADQYNVRIMKDGRIVVPEGTVEAEILTSRSIK